jgi:hypothetical protein
MVHIGLLVLMTLVNSTQSNTTLQPNRSIKTHYPTASEPLPEPKLNIIPMVTAERHGYFNPMIYSDATRLEFSNGISFDTKYLGINSEPRLPEELTYSNYGDESDYYIVQFNGPIYHAQREWLKENDIPIHFYVPHYGFVCSIKNKTIKDKISAHPAITWYGVYQPAYKISTLFDMVGEEHRVTMLLFMDADISQVLNDVKSITGRTEFRISDNGINKMIHGVISKNNLGELARVKGIYWIEPYIQPYTHNSNVQWILQDAEVDVRNIWDRGIAGEGEIVNTLDSGINTYHFAHRSGHDPITVWGYYPYHNAIVAYDSGAAELIQFGDGDVYHGTHTAGTLCGDDTLTAGGSDRDGVAKKARIYFLDGGDNSTNAIYTFGDLNDCYIRPYNRYYPPTRAYISSNSWGGNTAGAYTANCLNVDQFMWAHKDFVLFFSNGNSGPSGKVGSPAAAKNCVSVGGCKNGDPGYTQYYIVTSRGPTQDGRYKPTILSPGSQIISATTGTNNYQSLSGTSMASPGAAGAGALVRQYLREGWYPTGKKTAADSFPFISASLVKAILINGADPNVANYTVPDNNLGWGRVDLDSALYFEGDARKTLLIDNTVGLLTGEKIDYHFDIPADAADLKVALVWTDYPGNPVVLRQIVNDLDLSAYDGTTYYQGNQYSEGESIENPASRDSINVEECVRVNSPAEGDWHITIEARNVPCGPQPFSLVITYNAGSIAGLVSLDKPVYTANDFATDTVRIRIEDINYGVPSTIDSVLVAVHGDVIEIEPESIWCTELAESAGVFKGEISLLFNKAAHGDGQLSVGQGDTITVSYADENPSFTSLTWASVDAHYFFISNVHCENIEALAADVCWLTNENTNSTVYYGTDPGNLNQTTTQESLYCTVHAVRLTGLDPKTTYYYDVESEDFRGNRVIDDNGGQHYSFTTKASGAAVDILVALADGNDKTTNNGDPLPDLKERFQQAVERGGWTFTWWETSDHNGELPPRSELKNYKAIFVPNEDEYPPFLQNQQETIKVYQEHGGRIAFSAHDFLWHAWDNSSNKAYDTTWCKNYLHARYEGDITPTGTFQIYGIAADPISGDYTAGVDYTPHRSGACGDSLLGVDNPPNGWDTGTSSDVWRWDSPSGWQLGSKWESDNTHGSHGDGVWGGYTTRTIINAFTATQMDTAILPEILNKQFIWLIGHDHPDVTITAPGDSGTYTSGPLAIEWNTTAYGGASIDSLWIEYSPDAGNTWIPIASGAGIASPYDWDISNLQNNGKYRIRITVSDKDVYPAMKGFDETENFTISIPGNDELGPRIIPQSILVGNNPMIVTANENILPLSAIVSDSLSGLSTIIGAEWSLGSIPADPGNGSTMYASDGAFDETQEIVIDTMYFMYVPGATMICSVWVRGQDGSDKAQNWGNALMRTFTLIDGEPIIGISESGDTIPFSYTLSSPLPNPFARRVTISYGIPKTTKVSLKIYNCLGQVVNTLVDDTKKPGFYTIHWDGQDNLKRTVSAGIYFYRFSADDYTATKKMVMIK